MHDVARLGNEKLIRRHPHVFGDAEATTWARARSAGTTSRPQEKRAKGLDPDQESALKDMPAATAPLHQAYRYQNDAADCGFDWPDLAGVWDKLREEIGRGRGSRRRGDKAAIEHELGDLLFSVVNLARWLDIQPDMALRRANNRFRDRFHLVEAEFRTAKRPLKDAAIDDLEASWQRAKNRSSE